MSSLINDALELVKSYQKTHLSYVKKLAIYNKLLDENEKRVELCDWQPTKEEQKELDDAKKAFDKQVKKIKKLDERIKLLEEEVNGI